jgi:hypothetical protein
MGRWGLLASLLGVAIISCSLIAADEAKSLGKSRMPLFWSKLNLSAAQKQKVKEINAEYDTKIKALQKQIDDLKKQETADLDKILTDAQRTKLKELIAAKAGLDTSKDEKKPAPEKAPDKK